MCNRFQVEGPSPLHPWAAPKRSILNRVVNFGIKTDVVMSIFRLQFKIIIFLFKTNALKCEIVKYYLKQETVGVFLGRNFLKNYCHNWHQHPQFFQNAKLGEKTKILKFKTEIARVEYFLERIFLKNCCYI